jgi:hypothetical protein
MLKNMRAKKAYAEEVRKANLEKPEHLKNLRLLDANESLPFLE